MPLCKQGKTVPVLLCILLWMAQYNFLISNANTETWSIYKYRYQSDTQVIHSGHLALGPEILTNIGLTPNFKSSHLYNLNLANCAAENQTPWKTTDQRCRRCLCKVGSNIVNTNKALPRFRRGKVTVV